VDYWKLLEMVFFIPPNPFLEVAKLHVEQSWQHLLPKFPEVQQLCGRLKCPEDPKMLGGSLMIEFSLLNQERKI
jgi:hypothetical protein